MSTMVLEPPRPTYLGEQITSCVDCGHLSLGGATACEHCGGERLEALPRMGEIYSYTVVHRSDKDDSYDEPFILALVQLSGGPVVMGRIVGVDGELRIGSGVEIARHALRPLESQPGGLLFVPRRSADVLSR